MLVKPAVSFLTGDSDTLLLSRTTGIVAALTNNLNYPTPSPTLVALNASLNAFSSASAAAVAAGGGTVLTSAKNDARAALVVQLRELASYLQVACQNDQTKLLSSGYPVQKPQRQPIGVLPAPANLTLSLGARTGELNVKCDPMNGASIYNWRMSTAASPSAWKDMEQTTAASTVLTSLTPGAIYNVQVNVVGSAGPSDWSTIVALMVV